MQNHRVAKLVFSEGRRSESMWRIFFKYSDKSECTLTGNHKEIPLELARKYYNQYGVRAETAVYQQYPKKNNEPIDLLDKIEELEGA